jgi:hypothetical protein
MLFLILFGAVSVFSKSDVLDLDSAAFKKDVLRGDDTYFVSLLFLLSNIDFDFYIFHVSVP